jgi:hypothetical protein
MRRDTYQRFELGGVFLLRYLFHLSSSQVNVNTMSPLEDEISGEDHGCRLLTLALGFCLRSSHASIQPIQYPQRLLHITLRR